MAEPETPRLRVGGRLPRLEDLAQKTDAELNLLLRRFGLSIDRGQAIEDAVVRATRQLTRAKNPSEEVVERALRSAESAVRRELLLMSKETLRAHRRAQREDAEVLVWVSVLDERTCRDCEKLHGRKMTAAQWEAYGEPGEDNTVCDGNCRCTLEDAEDFSD